MFIIAHTYIITKYTKSHIIMMTVPLSPESFPKDNNLMIYKNIY